MNTLNGIVVVEFTKVRCIVSENLVRAILRRLTVRDCEGGGRSRGWRMKKELSNI